MPDVEAEEDMFSLHMTGIHNTGTGKWYKQAHKASIPRFSVSFVNDWLLFKVLRPTRHKIGHFAGVPEAQLALYGRKRN